MPCHCEGGSAVEFTGLVEDLSLGGLSLIDPSNIPRRGSKVHVVLRPEMEGVELEGRVVYVKAAKSGTGSLKVGIRFLGKLSEKREKLSIYLPRVMPSHLLVQ
jgi:hypothetical protein